MPVWNTIADLISQTSGQSFDISQSSAVGGGCINSAYRLEGSDGSRYFVKLNKADKLTMFEAEAEGLNEIRASGAIHAPAVIGWGAEAGHAFLVLEYLDLGHGDSDSAQRLGRNLAAMHRHSQSHFGWHRDNTIGATPQPNTPSSDWVDFWRQQRLGFQLELAKRHGCGDRLYGKGVDLMARLEPFFKDYQPRPALLHGDLWSGNYAFTTDGTPVIFDPAVYYGDREADLAMTELFGGFPPEFYQAYEEAYPLDPGYTQRKRLYNLYHILNHFNLFGGGYLGQAETMIDELLRSTL